MKVTGNEHLQPPFLKNKNHTENIKNSQFNKILNEKLGAVSSAGSNAVPHPVLNKPSPFQIPPVTSKIEVLTKVSGFLNIMEEYSEKLADPDYTLRDLQGIVGRLNEEKESLRSIADTLPAGERVRDIIEEALIRVSVETIRFERGDYL